MKKILALSAVLFSILVLIQSCTKQSHGDFGIAQSVETPLVQIFNANVSSGNTYTFNLGTPENVSITRQASHYQLSEIGIDNKNGSLNYKYSPSANYSGTDEVSLTSIGTPASGNSGCHNGDQNNSSGTIITIKINVTN